MMEVDMEYEVEHYDVNKFLDIIISMIFQNGEFVSLHIIIFYLNIAMFQFLRKILIYPFISLAIS